MSMNLMIKKLRKDKGITQEQLADNIGVSLMTVRRWEWGDTTPNSKMLIKLADTLGTTPENLLDDGTEKDDISVSLEMPSERKTPTMAYWGGVLDNAQRAVRDGQNLKLIYSLLADATSTVKAAMA